MLIMVTGASGFVGKALCETLLSKDINVRKVVRSSGDLCDGKSIIAVGDINGKSDWRTALIGVDCIVHCAARAHIMHERAPDCLEAYREVNVAGTLRLAEQAVEAGVQRLVFLSSIKVNGDHTQPGKPFIDISPDIFTGLAAPVDPYALSKWEAELVLRDVALRTGLELVIVRPPLIYGKGVKGNLARILKLVYSGVPLPVASIENSRSMIGLDNLLDLLIHCMSDPRAAGQTFLASDGEDLSTPDLVRRIAQAMGRAPHLFSVPTSLLKIAGRVVSKEAEIDRLINFLQIDSSQTQEILSWLPPFPVNAGIQIMVDHFLKTQQ